MVWFFVLSASFTASLLTLFTGFGLGTLLLPVFALFFPLPMAISLTALVHLTNNLFKFLLLGRYADRETVLRFGIPAMIAAFAGAACLIYFEGMAPLLRYEWRGLRAEVTVLKSIIAGLMVCFAFFEAVPFFQHLSFDRRYLTTGGILSGFLGGLSGHQGALRSAFLFRCGFSKEVYIGTGVVISCLVDISRLALYSARFTGFLNGEQGSLALAAVGAAFAGAFLGNRLLKKISIALIRFGVTVMLVLIAAALASGIL